MTKTRTHYQIAIDPIEDGESTVTVTENNEMLDEQKLNESTEITVNISKLQSEKLESLKSDLQKLVERWECARYTRSMPQRYCKDDVRGLIKAQDELREVLNSYE